MGFYNCLKVLCSVFVHTKKCRDIKKRRDGQAFEAKLRPVKSCLKIGCGYKSLKYLSISGSV